MLELQHISYETEENREILHDISLTIQDRFVAITGPNGGGKSTLAKIIAGIYTPTSGRILLDGEDITALSITERALFTGFGGTHDYADNIILICIFDRHDDHNFGNLVINNITDFNTLLFSAPHYIHNGCRIKSC